MNKIAILLAVMLAASALVTGCSLLKRDQNEARRASFFNVDPRDAKMHRSLAREADHLLATCNGNHMCDRAHYLRGLAALFENRDEAEHHLEAAVSNAPSSTRAAPSLFWLQMLQENPSGIEDPILGEVTEQLLRDLLAKESQVEHLTKEVDASPVQNLQRELKARDKKVEDLTKQLEALKQIDQEMREQPLPGRTPSKPSVLKKESR